MKYPIVVLVLIGLVSLGSAYTDVVAESGYASASSMLVNSVGSSIMSTTSVGMYTNEAISGQLGHMRYAEIATSSENMLPRGATLTSVDAIVDADVVTGRATSTYISGGFDDGRINIATRVLDDQKTLPVVAGVHVQESVINPLVDDFGAFYTGVPYAQGYAEQRVDAGFTSQDFDWTTWSSSGSWERGILETSNDGAFSVKSLHDLRYASMTTDHPPWTGYEYTVSNAIATPVVPGLLP